MNTKIKKKIKVENLMPNIFKNQKVIVRKKIQLREKIDRKVWLKEYSRKDILELFLNL